MARVRILVRNKKGVFDPEGKVVHTGLARLGYDDVSDVRVGKVIEIEMDGAEDAIGEKVDAMCKAFLVNPVIEDYSYEIVG